MSREPEQSGELSADFDQRLEFDKLKASIEESESLERAALEEKHGPDVRLLAEDDERLLNYLKSEDLSRKQLALRCLCYFRTVYPAKIAGEAAEYAVHGLDINTRLLCVRYLSKWRTGPTTAILRDCADRLATHEARPGDDVVLRTIAFCLDPVSGGPPLFADIASRAEEILERLYSSPARADQDVEATGSRSAENGHDA